MAAAAARRRFSPTRLYPAAPLRYAPYKVYFVMPKKMKNKLKRIITPWAESLSFPVRVYFFGSRSRGNPRPESDLDIAVQPLIPEMDTIDRQNKVYDIENKLEALLHEATGLKIHVVYYSGRNDTDLGRNLKKEGQILWEHDNEKDLNRLIKTSL